MSRGARILVYVLAGLCALGGFLMLAQNGGGVVLIGLGVLLAASVALEGRYQFGRATPNVPAERWVRTGEREIDTETGEPREVWFDPVTGARRYEPMAPDRTH